MTIKNEIKDPKGESESIVEQWGGKSWWVTRGDNYYSRRPNWGNWKIFNSYLTK